VRSALFAAALGAVATPRLHPGWRLTDVTRSADFTRCVVGVDARGAPTANRVATAACMFFFVCARSWGSLSDAWRATKYAVVGRGRYPPLHLAEDLRRKARATHLESDLIQRAWTKEER